MAGVQLRVEIDDTEVRAALHRLASAGHDLTPVMRDIGEHLLGITRERFRAEEAPDGTPWAPLTLLTKAGKHRNRGRILTERGFLSGNLAYRADATSVVIGSPSIYAGTHQFGAKKGAFGASSSGQPIPWGDIPARPFLGLSDADADEIIDIVRDHLVDHLAPAA